MSRKIAESHIPGTFCVRRFHARRDAKTTYPALFATASQKRKNTEVCYFCKSASKAVLRRKTARKNTPLKGGYCVCVSACVSTGGCTLTRMADGNRVVPPRIPTLGPVCKQTPRANRPAVREVAHTQRFGKNEKMGRKD